MLESASWADRGRALPLRVVEITPRLVPQPRPTDSGVYPDPFFGAIQVAGSGCLAWIEEVWSSCSNAALPHCVLQALWTDRAWTDISDLSLSFIYKPSSWPASRRLCRGWCSEKEWCRYHRIPPSGIGAVGRPFSGLPQTAGSLRQTFEGSSSFPKPPISRCSIWPASRSLGEGWCSGKESSTSDASGLTPARISARASKIVFRSYAPVSRRALS